MSSEDPHAGQLDELIEDYLARLRRGEAPDVADYAARHGDLAEQILDLFPTLEVVEGSAQSSEDRTPPSFPGFEILDEKASAAGGMGVVYRAREVSLDRIVAVKTARAHLGTEEGRAFFEREARAAGRLDHPHIVRVLSFHPDHEPPYYVMPFVEGRPLREACRGRDARFAAQLLEKVARAVAYAHDHGVVHRDLKPQNILVDHDGEPHVTDFGLASDVGAVLRGSAAAGPTSLRGTPHYIAPELWADGTADPRTDVYALGVTLYVLLTGRQPFEGNDLETLRAAIARAAPPLPVEVDPEIPEPLQRICLKAMEPDPAHRYESARMLADDLRRFAEGRDPYARPTRYLRERQGKLHNHLTDIRLWRQQRLIDTREMDRMARPYHRLLEADSAWDELSRRYPWETALLRLGGWLAVVSSVLWPAFYWDDLVRWQRVAALAAPCFLLNAAGWLYWRRRSSLNAVVFLSSGSLLLPMLIAVVLAEYGWLRVPQLAARELFGGDAAVPAPGRFALTNFQVCLVTGSFVGYALLLLAAVRARLFALWVGAGAYLLYSAVLLLLGLVYWLDHDRVAWALVAWLPACLLFVPAAGILRRRGQVGQAAIFYAFFPLPFVLVLTLLARFGAEEGLGAPGDWDAEAVQLWLMAHGLIYLVLGLAHGRSGSGVARFWGELFLVLVPVSLLVPTNVLFEHEPFVGTAGGQGVSAYELGAVAISIALVVFGTRIRRTALVAPGLLGLAVAVARITERHFEEHLAWPFGLAIAGGLAMVTGAWLTFARSKKNKPPA